MSHPICRTVIAQFFESVWTNNRYSHPIMITRPAPAWLPAGVPAPLPLVGKRCAIGAPARRTNRMGAGRRRRRGP